jgi:hypothetical protein
MAMVVTLANVSGHESLWRHRARFFNAGKQTDCQLALAA